MMRLALALAAIALATPQTAFAFEPPFPIVAVISGTAGVKDGDGILFGDVEIRLQGIAAPEDRRGKVDPHGKASTRALEELALGRQVVCYLDGTRANRRPVGVCVLEGRDLGRVMVEIGAARDCPAYSLGRYAASEDQARKSGNNLSIEYSLPPYC